MSIEMSGREELLENRHTRRKVQHNRLFRDAEADTGARHLT